MSAYSGSALNVQWVQIAATTTLTGDYRKFTFTPSISFVDETAGADAHKQYISGIKDSNATFEAVLQSGTGAGGTATFGGTILTEGSYGTLIWSPEGTAASKPKFTWPCFSQGVSYSESYDDIVPVTVNFQGNGAVSHGTN